MVHDHPVIIGVGEVKNASIAVNDAVEPLQLMRQSVEAALQDTAMSTTSQIALKSDVDSISIVRTWTWPYQDLPGLLSEKLGISPSHRYYSDHGGNQPAKLCDEAARRISCGQSKAAIIVGGEALASRISSLPSSSDIDADRDVKVSACIAAKQMPPQGWTEVASEVASVYSPTTRDLGTGSFSARLILCLCLPQNRHWSCAFDRCAYPSVSTL